MSKNGFTQTKAETMEQAIENEQNTLVVVREDIPTLDLMEQLKNPTASFFCSIKDDGSRKSKIAIYNAINSADKSLAEHIGEVLEVTNVIAHPVRLADEVTGEIIESLRTVLITKDGTSYTAVSEGITNSLSRVFSIIGMPPWNDEPVKMKVKQVKTRNGNNKVNTLELVE